MMKKDNSLLKREFRFMTFYDDTRKLLQAEWAYHV